MKKLFAALLLAGAMLFAVQANAQIIADGGILSYNINRHHDSIDPWNNSTSGIYAGASYNYDLPFLKGLSVVPGAYLYYSSETQMSDFSFYPLIYDTKATHKESGLLVPVMASYRYSFTSDSSVFLNLGPTFNLGFSSTTKGDLSDGATNHFKNGDFNRCDLMFGGNIGAVILKNYLFYITYHRGLLNAAGSNYNGTGYRYNRAIAGLGLGYIF